MKLINLLRYTKGYVKFTVSGGFRERFINLCNQRGIRLWNIVPEIDKIQACVSIKNFHLLRSIVRESGVKLQIIQKRGLPLFFKKHRYRSVLMAGIFFIIAFYIIMNRFIWFIDVEGTGMVSHEEIINVIGNYGVKIGAYSPAIDEIYAGRNAINAFNGRLLWVSVNIKGSRAVIEVRDYVDEHKDTTFGNPCNIVADFDGTLLSIETFNGDKEMLPGSAVKKGDLLISGVIQNRDMSASYLEARGKITAHHNINFNRSYKQKRMCTRYTNVKEYTYPKIIGIEIPLTSDNKNSLCSYEEFIKLQNTKLPFGAVYRTNADEYKYEDTYTVIHAVDAYINDFYSTFANTNILEYSMSVDASSEGYSISADMSCIDFMGVKSEIYVEQ